MSIGLQIKRLMWKEDMLQKDLVEKLSISQPTLSSYCNDRRIPRADVLKDIAEVFGITDMNYFWK